MARISAKPDTEIQARFFHGLSYVSHLVILGSLRDGEKTVSEVAEAAGLTISNTNRHLLCLRNYGMVEALQNWRHVFYRLAEGVMEIPETNATFIARVADKITACQRPETKLSEESNEEHS